MLRAVIVAALLVVLLPQVLISQSLAYTVNISIKGYDGEALLNVTSADLTMSRGVKTGSKIELPEGLYVFSLFALNKTFQKEVNLTKNTTLTFNLLFTNSTENLPLIRHIIVYSSTQIDVYEILLITNSGDRNFEGNISVPLPDHRNLNVKESTLSFITADDMGDRINFYDIIVPANDSGRITFSYSLKSNVFKISDSEKQRLMLLSALPVEEYMNLSYKGIQEFGGQRYRVFEGNITKCSLVFGGEKGAKVDPVALIGILIISASLFFYLKSKSSRWEDE
jgi:hypothetical protein